MEIIIILLLIVINGFFSLSEIALVSSNRNVLKQLQKKGNSSAAIALQLLQESENFLSSIQVGITLVGIVTGMYGGINLADDVVPYIQTIPYLHVYALQVALVLTVIVITYFSIVFGELVPKTIALSNPEKIACRVAPIIYYFTKIFFPIIRVLSISTSYVNRVLKVKPRNEQITEAELRQMLQMASSEGVIEIEQNVMHEKVFYFADKRAKHIMTHRIDVEWINLDQEDSLIAEQIKNTYYTKILCCKGDLDNFVGVLSVKDYYKYCSVEKQLWYTRYSHSASYNTRKYIGS
jgi:putative hemolysin